MQASILFGNLDVTEIRILPYPYPARHRSQLRLSFLLLCSSVYH